MHHAGILLTMFRLGQHRQLPVVHRLFLAHDDVIKWKHFPRYWHFCAGNSPVSGEFPAQMPVTRSFDVFFDLRLIKWLSKHARGWWFETLSRPLWRHCNAQRLPEKTQFLWWVRGDTGHPTTRWKCSSVNFNTRVNFELTTFRLGDHLSTLSSEVLFCNSRGTVKFDIARSSVCKLLKIHSPV